MESDYQYQQQEKVLMIDTASERGFKEIPQPHPPSVATTTAPLLPVVTKYEYEEEEEEVACKQQQQQQKKYQQQKKSAASKDIAKPAATNTASNGSDGKEKKRVKKAKSKAKNSRQQQPTAAAAAKGNGGGDYSQMILVDSEGDTEQPLTLYYSQMVSMQDRIREILDSVREECAGIRKSSQQIHSLYLERFQQERDDAQRNEENGVNGRGIGGKQQTRVISSLVPRYFSKFT